MFRRGFFYFGVFTGKTKSGPARSTCPSRSPPLISVLIFRPSLPPSDRTLHHGPCNDATWEGEGTLSKSSVKTSSLASSPGSGNVPLSGMSVALAPHSRRPETDHCSVLTSKTASSRRRACPMLLDSSFRSAKLSKPCACARGETRQQGVIDPGRMYSPRLRVILSSLSSQ